MTLHSLYLLVKKKKMWKRQLKKSSLEHQQHTWNCWGGGITDLFVCEAGIPRSGSRRAEIHPVVFGLSAEQTRSIALEIFPMSLLSSLSLSLSFTVTHTTQEPQLESTLSDVDPLYEWAHLQEGTHACTGSATERLHLMTASSFFFFTPLTWK